ncbi:hypothetical protein BDF14DRAFT_1880528 [Spinellus fusiger]|nr:hypothetical protein BDF14DRAFT_1880528 [Spinellus fusiger]
MGKSGRHALSSQLPSGIEKMSPSACSIAKQIRELDCKMEVIKQAKKDQDENKTYELQVLIEEWRTVAQEVIQALYNKAENQESFYEARGVEDSIKSLGQLISALRLDPDLVHYYEKTDSFY